MQVTHRNSLPWSNKGRRCRWGLFAGMNGTGFQWTTAYGDGAGLIVYAIVHKHQRVIVLRLV